MKIAILGASGQIGKCLALEYSKNPEHELYLYARSIDKLQAFMSNQSSTSNYSVCEYKDFQNHSFGLIINCVGNSDPAFIKRNPQSIFETTEIYDNLCLSHLRKNNRCIYIFLSSGAAYNANCDSPMGLDTAADLQVNQINTHQFYGITKFYTEAKHKAHKDLHIINVRIFNFISQYIDLGFKFLITDIINCIINNKTFKTDSNELVRDFIGVRELKDFIDCALEHPQNDSFDLMSTKPISKTELVEHLSKDYGLEVEINKIQNLDGGTGAKNVYCSSLNSAQNIGYVPQRSSMEVITDCIDALKNQD